MIGLLSFMLGATETSNSPEVAPEGIVTLIDVLLHELIIIGVAFRVTTLPACVAPKLEPVITTVLPIAPVVAETLLITGAGAADELTDTLSKVAVASVDELVPLDSTNPTYTLGDMFTVWAPTSVQLVPSGEP